MQKFTVAISILFLASVSLHATTIHVPSEQPTIQAGINAASAGDTVLIACGEYTWVGESTATFSSSWGWSLIIHKEGVILRSETGQPECVLINAMHQGRVFLCEGLSSTSAIEGFTVKNGSTLYGGGVVCSSSSTRFSYCLFTENEVSHVGGGLYCSDGSMPLVSFCRFIRNSSASDGGAIGGVDSEPVVIGSSFIGNSAGDTGGALKFLRNSTILSSCTLHANTAVSGGALYLSGATASVTSSIAWGNEPDELYIQADSQVWVSCTDVQGGWPGEGNIDLDPLFCDPELGDFSLRNDSPCAPENNDCGVLMGAWPVGCSTSAENATWSEFKVLF